MRRLELKRRSLLALGSLFGMMLERPLQAHNSNNPANLLFTKQWNYIIAGCGAAGLSAAISAAENGLDKILVVEKEPLIGGASILCEGVWCIAGTPLQKFLGIHDSEALFFANLIKDAKGTSDPKIVRAYIDNCLPLYHWFSDRSIYPSEVIKNTGMNIPRGHTFDPLEVMIYLRKRAHELGIAIVTNTRAKKLILNNNEVVTGLQVQRGNNLFNLSSKLGVLLSTGGFSRNPQLIKKFAPKMINSVKLSCAGAEGDGLLMALDVGAGLADINNIRAAYGFILNPSSVFDISQVIYSGAISVNVQGQRYVNESLPYKDIGEIALEQPSQKTYLIFDSLILREQMKHRAADARLFAGVLEGKVPSFMLTANSLEELAKTAKLPIENFLKTVDKYNYFVEIGKDEEFGRRHLTLDYGTMRKIQHPPFFLLPTTSAMMGTNGGVKVDEFTRVLRSDLSPIVGLYAAGEMMGGFHGNSFMGGTSYGKALVFGYINGQFIARQRKSA